MTTTITLPRAVVEQALGALDAFSWEQVDAARIALHAALAQQAEPVEPVACIDALKDAFFEGFTSVATYNDTLLNSPEEAWEKYKPPHTAPPQRAEPTLQTCNCRWDGEVQVQQCTLHEAHVDAIHEWAERAKTAEKKLAALAQQAEPVAQCSFPGCQTTGGCVGACTRAVGRAHGVGRQSDHQIEDRLARHGINPCPDCRGIGYDAIGQLCWCQQNPSF